MAEKKQQVKPSKEAVITAMFRLLNALVRHPEHLDNPAISEAIFTHETAKSLYVAINNLREKGVEITPMSVLQAGQEVDFNISKQVVETVFNIDQTGADNLDDILGLLQVAKAKDSIADKLEWLQQRIKEPGPINQEALQRELYDIEQLVQGNSKDKSSLLNFVEAADKYLDDVQIRRLGHRYSFGDPLLDEAFPRGATPGSITIITARSSMGKSTLVLSLMDTLMEMNSPALYLSLEMGTIDTMDRFIAKRCSIPNSELYLPENMDTLEAAVKGEQEKLKNHNKFYFCEATNVDITKLRNLIREFKQKAKADYGMIAIDLLSGMTNFMVSDSGVSSAVSIENNLNKLEQLAKEENVHILGVVQLKRETGSLQLTSIEQAEEMRPSANELKNSSAYFEKCSICLACHRPKYYVDRTAALANDPAAQTMEDIMEVQILKDRNGGNAGKILRYVFDGEYYRVFPVIDDPDDPDSKLKKLQEATV